MAEVTHFPDHWLHLDDQPLPHGGHITLPWSRWQQDAQAVLGWQAADSTRRIGVRITVAQSPGELSPWFEQLALVIVESERFGDGRIFSIARLLRRYGFTGELRARGDLLPDQVTFLGRCGFDSVEMLNGQPTHAPTRFYRGYYQPVATDSSDTLAIRRARLQFDAELKDIGS